MLTLQSSIQKVVAGRLVFRLLPTKCVLSNTQGTLLVMFGKLIPKGKAPACHKVAENPHFTIVNPREFGPILLLEFSSLSFSHRIQKYSLLQICAHKTVICIDMHHYQCEVLGYTNHQWEIPVSRVVRNLTFMDFSLATKHVFNQHYKTPTPTNSCHKFFHIKSTS